MKLYQWMMSVSALGCLCSASAQAEVHLPAMFGDNMVVQRDRAVPVFGSANPGEKVSVTFGEQKVGGVAVAEPMAVRYDWADNPAGNLFNQTDLPAGPFRTDPPATPIAK